MVPIKEAINSGAWLHCEYIETDDKIIKFRLKINSIRKLDLSEIDNPKKIDNLDNDSILWLMNIEVININDRILESYNGPGELILVDQDGYSFYVLNDWHLCLLSDFSKTSGTNKFCSEDLIPKIKVVGSIIFILPDDDDAEYSISIKNNGTVQEV